MDSYIVICIGMPGYGWCGPRLGFTDFPRYFVRYISKDVAKMATERVAELVDYPARLAIKKLCSGV